MSHTALLTAENLGLTLPDGRALFSNLSVSIGPGLTGLTGANGSGKSVLAHLLAGRRPPSRGMVHRHCRVGLLVQGHHLQPHRPDETVAHRLGVHRRLAALGRILSGGVEREDYALVGDDGWDLPARIEARLDGAGLGHLNPERPLNGLSGGERARLSLVSVLLEEPELLILDEPTNDLDAGSVDRILEMLAAWPGSVLAISHHRGLLRRADRILELRAGGLESYGGSYDVYRERREAAAEAARAELDRAEAARRKARRDAARTRERQERRNARGARTRGDGSQPATVLNARREGSEATTARLGRNRERDLARAGDRLRSARARVEDRPGLRVAVPSAGLSSGRIVLRMEGAGWRAPDGTPVLSGVDLLVRGPERIAVVGPNGAGKTTLLRLALGALQPTEGSVALGVSRTRVAHLDQAASLPPGETLLEALQGAHPGVPVERIRARLARHLFRGRAADRPVAALSGGERVRASLACALAGDLAPALLVLDEPTNHLDLESLEAVEEALRSFQGALLVVSHDADFLDAVGVDRRLSLSGPGAPCT